MPPLAEDTFLTPFRRVSVTLDRLVAAKLPRNIIGTFRSISSKLRVTTDIPPGENNGVFQFLSIDLNDMKFKRVEFHVAATLPDTFDC